MRVKLGSDETEMLRRLVLAEGRSLESTLARAVRAYWAAAGGVDISASPRVTVETCFAADASGRVSARAAREHFKAKGGIPFGTWRDFGREIRALGGERTTVRENGKVVDGWAGIRPI